MWTRSSTPSRRPWPPNRRTCLALTLAAVAGCSKPATAPAQQLVYDPKNYLESAVHTAHQLESLSNEARMLANQARQLAASPYSHLAQTSKTLQDIGELARSARGIATNTTQLETQFQTLYPAAVQGADPANLLRQAESRATAARDTAQDLARTAAQLEQLSQGRGARVSGALAASQSAQGATSAIQSSAQLLAVLSEDTGSLRAVTLAQARLLAEEVARREAERAAGQEARRRLWANDGVTPPPPSFNPLSHEQR
jgi:P-type conjugative transfer protein TrbJ